MSELRFGGVKRGRRLSFEVDGKPVEAYEGETVAAALWASGIRKLRSSPVKGAPRGMFCYMGVCQECVVMVDGVRVTSCSHPVTDGLSITLS